jgi:hypothetical protein
MSVSRRKFLRAGTLVALAAGFPLKTLAAETLGSTSSLLPAYGDPNSLMYLDREAFSSQLNTKFSFSHGNAQAVAVKLIEVNDLTPKTAKRSAGKECFAAVFIGSNDAPLRQETYIVKHKSLGQFSMLVVPVAHKREGVYYEAVFNRRH